MDEKIDGGPSVLFDAIVVLTTEDGAKDLMTNAAARSFITDAANHHKFIGYLEPSTSLIEQNVDTTKASLQLVKISNPSDVKAFLEKCSQIRHWQ